jgi:hypothetical protein
VQLGAPADQPAADLVEQRLQRDALGQEQEAVVGGDHPQVAEHAALVGQQRGVAAVAGLERGDLVADLAVEELARLVPGEQQLAQLGAVDEAGTARAGLVRGGKGIDGGHVASIRESSSYSVERIFRVD